MAEIELTIPTVQYGNVKIRATPEELGLKGLDPYTTGMMAGTWLVLATMGFEESKKLDLDPHAEFKAEVTGQYQESPEEPHPITEVSPEEAEEIIKTLGATTVEPWTKTQPQAKKAWEDFDL